MSSDPGFTPAPDHDERADVLPPAGPPGASARRQSAKAIAALTCGASSFAIGLLVGPPALLLSLAALVLGIIARKEIAADATLDGDGMAIAGIVMGIVGIVLTILLVVLVVFALTAFDLS